MKTGGPRQLPPLLADAEGQTLTVYHYGQGNVDEFQPLSHFGTMKAAFERFIQKDVLVKGTSQDVYLNGNVFYPVHLRIKNPLIVDDDFTWAENGVTHSCMKQLSGLDVLYTKEPQEQGKMTVTQVAEELRAGGLFVAGDDDGKNRNNLVKQRIIAVLEKQGYDGIAYMNRDEDIGSISWVNLRPQQVESAISGPFTTKPCQNLEVPKDGLVSKLIRQFDSSATATGQELGSIRDRRWSSSPKTVDGVVAYFQGVQDGWDSDVRQRELLFRSSIAVAALGQEEIDRRVQDGDTTIAAFYESCRRRMVDLATKSPQAVEAWQRPYLDEIRQRFGQQKKTSAPTPPKIFTPS